MIDPPLTAPAVERNKNSILAVLRRALPEVGVVLEIASGTGQHVVYFAQALPRLTWQPSDLDDEMRSSIAAWIRQTGIANVRPPVALDVREETWPVEHADAVLCINMIHISPWSATLGLLRGTAQLLGPSGLLILYGPYRRGGRHTAPSNEAFDAQLKASNAEWGVRDLEAVEDAARSYGLCLEGIVEMPANNLTLAFRPGTFQSDGGSPTK
jgi:SAM-dependent methyltransferase